MEFDIPIGPWIAAGVDYLRDNAAGFFDAISAGIEALVDAIEGALLWLPPWLLALIIIAIAAWRVGWRFGVFALVSMALVFGMDLWEQTIETLALIASATVVSLAIGIPLGIAASRSDRVETALRPVLDLMQTLPPFVYLIPAAMFFGIGKVPGALATIIFSMPPAVRLTNLGIRQVPKEIVEAGLAFGCTDRQLLFKVQVPNAMPSIMAGVNQTIMLALSMVVIASMIGAGGLGNTVLTGIQRLDVGLGFEGGLGVVILAVLLDRIMQSFGRRREPVGPIARLRALFQGKSDAPSQGAGADKAAGHVARQPGE
ncbi:MAG: proline/glycine betaine ABC transporter permease [Azospirillaceae bacterium]